MSDQKLVDQGNDSLLDFIYQYIGCDYLSDINRGGYRRVALKLALEIDGGRYPLREWSECFSYILHTKICADSVEEIKKQSLDYAKQHHIL